MSVHIESQEKENTRFTSKDKKLRVVTKILRWTILGSMLIFILTASILHTLGYAAPSMHGTCPYGGLSSALSIIAFGTLLKQILIGTFIIFAVTMAIAVFFKRSYCGQICAFGALQEFLGNAGRRIFKKKRLIIPPKLDRVFRYLKYVVLIVTVAMSWATAELWLTPYCPYNALGHLVDFQSLTGTYLIGFIILIITLLGSLLYERFFCKYLCPAGAFYALVGKVSPYAVRIDKDKCIKCSKCNDICPMNVDVMNSKSNKIISAECINCNKCVNTCPKKGALSIGFSRKAIIHPLIATILVIVLFFAPILIAKASGNFQILPNKFANSSRSHETTDQEDSEDCNQNNTGKDIYIGNIRGSMTMGEISILLDLPIRDIYSKIGLPENFPADFTIKQAAESLGSDLGELKKKLLE